MASFEAFKLTELRLDHKNYRIGAAASQRDAIAAIINDQQDKLVNLAEDLLALGLSPGEPVWVTRDTDTPGMYIVLEGNRRVAALKIMEAPALAAGTVVEKAFSALAGQFSEKPIRQIEALVFATRDEAKPWQRRRHMTSVSGVGLQGWKPLAKARANRDQGAKAQRFLAVVDYLQDDSDEWAGLADVLDPKWTTVDRVLNASTLSTVLGISINPKTGIIVFENGKEEDGRSLLKRVLRGIAAPEFRFSDIESDRDREAFIARFADFAVKVKEGGNAASPNSGVEPPSGVAPSTDQPKLPLEPQPPGQPAAQPKATAAPFKTKPIPAPRGTLAPRTGGQTFSVKGDRLNGLYRECRVVVVKNNENAACFLLRVFIELSSEALLEEKGIPIPPSVKGRSNWDDTGIPLAVKVNAVLGVIDDTGKSKTLAQVRVACDPKSTASFSISTLHGYFHNRHMKPDSMAIIDAWDAWEIYLQQLHAAR